MSNIIPEGTYRARCLETDLGSSKTGKEQIMMNFQITEEGQWCGKHWSGYFYFSDKAADYTFEKMRNAGWQGDDLADLSSLSPSNVECLIVISHEEYEGKTRVKIDYVNKLGGGVKMADPMDAAKRKAFAERMRGKAIASKQYQVEIPKNDKGDVIPF